MKKFFSLMLVALVMLGVTACEQDVTIDTPKSEGLSFYAEIVMTRADLVQGDDENGNVVWNTSWEEGDVLTVNDGNDTYYFKNSSDNVNKFTCEEEGAVDLLDKAVTVELNNGAEVWTLGKKGIKASASVDKFAIDTTVELVAMNSFFRYTYTGEGNVGLSLTYDNQDTVPFGNDYTYYPVDSNKDTEGNVWVAFDVPTDGDSATLSYSINGVKVKETTINLAQGKVYNLGDLTDNTVYVYKPITSLVDLTDGEYIIVATVDDKSYAMSDTLKGGKINGSEIQLTDGVVSLENAEGFVWNIAEITDGNFSISNGTKYLSWSSSTNFGLVDDVYSWIPSSENEGWKFVAGTTARCILFQTQNGNNRFGPYAVSNFTSTDYKPIKLYKKMAENEEPYKTPIITADITSKSVGVEGEKFEISVTATNFDVEDIVVEKDVEWFTATHNGEGKIDVSVAENATTSVREGYITISYPGATSVVVTLSQTANAVKTTIAEFLAAAEDDTLYELSGTIISVVNTTNGNFTIMDDTGEVYIYGLCSPEGAEEYWSKSKAKLGDNITIKTVRTSYNGTAQGKNAIFVELVSPGTRAFWTFDKTDVNFESNGGSVDVNVKIYNLDEEVTVASDNAQFTASYSDTDGVLTITAIENTVSEVIEGKITVTCGTTLSQIIAVTQKAAAAAGTKEESVTFSEQNYTNGQAIESYTGTNFTVTFAKGSNSNVPKYYTSGEAIRCYGGNTFTVSSKKKIINIELTFGDSDGSNIITASSGSYSNGTWTGSSENVTFTIGGTSGNRRIEGISVTYTE